MITTITYPQRAPPGPRQHPSPKRVAPAPFYPADSMDPKSAKSAGPECMDLSHIQRCGRGTQDLTLRPNSPVSSSSMAIYW